MRATIKDVAREAGVSVSTVSYALSRKGAPIKASHKRVVEAAERLGYVPDATARSLVRSRTNNIGVVIQSVPRGSLDTYNPYYAEMITMFAEELEKRGCWMSLYLHDMRSGGEEDFFTDANVDGFIWYGASALEKMISISNRRSLPHVGIYHSAAAEDGSRIVTGDMQSAREAVEYLAEIGHRRILCVAGSEKGDFRERVYYEVADERQLGYRHSIYGYYDENGAYTAMRRFLESGEERPTAVFASSDYMALGVLRALSEAGLSVPGDVSVMGYDDILSARFASPPLTTVKQDLREVARAAVDYICKWRDEREPGPGMDLRVPSKIIIRKSTAAPRA